MNPYILLTVIALYFLFLVGISKIVDRKSDEDSFFTGNKNSPWYLVAFGMIGASLSGVTFVSIPGAVTYGAFGYFQMVLGYIIGYIVIALVLLPLYYKLNITSIYSYLNDRFGRNAQLVGAFFFMVSKILGAALRMYLVVLTLQNFVFNPLGIHYAVTTAIALFLIWIYTAKSGIKTIVYTDTLQTVFMLASLVCTIVYIVNSFDMSLGQISNELGDMGLTKIFFVDDWKAGTTFWKQFVGGALIAITMTGLDQDMMQKNLTCPNIKEAQKNVYSFTFVMVFVNALFLILGALLVFYITKNGIDVPKAENGKYITDLMFPTLALQHFSPILGLVFFVGLIAAAYSSADSALAALTTSFCFDIMQWKDKQLSKNKNYVHIGFAVVMYFVILIFYQWNNRAAVNLLFTLASYTYGPLLGLFTFGIFTKKQKIDTWITPAICVISPILTYYFDDITTELFDYKFGTELLLINGGITFVLLLLLPDKKIESSMN